MSLLRVLIIEDDYREAIQIEKIVKSMGFEAVAIVDNAASALEIGLNGKFRGLKSTWKFDRIVLKRGLFTNGCKKT